MQSTSIRTSRGARTLNKVTRTPVAVNRPVIRTTGNGLNASGTSGASGATRFGGAAIGTAFGSGVGTGVAVGVGSGVSFGVGVGVGVGVGEGVGAGVGAGAATITVVGFERAWLDPALFVTFSLVRRNEPTSASAMR
jgi:hypothetical protein